MRLPGQSDTIEVGQDPRRYWYAAAENPDEPLVPPAFAEELEQQVREAAKRVGRVAPTRDLHAPDRALARVLAAEAKRRAKSTSSGYSFYKPYFDEPIHQRQLRIFNSLARALEPLYGPQEVRCEDKWIQGIGTLHHLILHLTFGAATIDPRFFEPSDSRARDRKAASAPCAQVGRQLTIGCVDGGVAKPSPSRRGSISPTEERRHESASHRRSSRCGLRMPLIGRKLSCAYALQRVPCGRMPSRLCWVARWVARTD